MLAFLPSEWHTSPWFVGGMLGVVHFTLTWFILIRSLILGMIALLAYSAQWAWCLQKKCSAGTRIRFF